MAFLKFFFKTGALLLPFAYMGLIWFLSDRHVNAVVELGTFDALIKESLHLIEFAILYGLWVFALIMWERLTALTSLIAAGVSIAYGLVDELHQYYVPSRSATLDDLLKDTIGVLIAWYLVNRYWLNRSTISVD